VELSGSFDDHALDDVRHVFAPIHGLFQVLENLFPLDDQNGVLDFFEQLDESRPENHVGVVFELVDGDTMFIDGIGVLNIAQML